MPNDTAFYLLVGFLVLCFLATVVEFIGHIKDKKREKVLVGVVYRFLKSIFESRSLEDEVSVGQPNKKEQRPS
jgi:hypothetical protein